MLIVTRKEGETIIIADKIEVTVMSIEGGQVRLGIEAPREIRIHRKELLERIQRANQEAATSKSQTHLPRLPQQQA